jgi:ribonuclease HI
MTVLENIKWYAPECGWIRFNTAGTYKGGSVAGCGRVSRGKNGKWICVFLKRLGVCSAYVAELLGVFESLNLARPHGFHKIVLHVDS